MKKAALFDGALRASCVMALLFGTLAAPAFAKDQKSTRGYVVGDGGVAREAQSDNRGDGVEKAEANNRGYVVGKGGIAWMAEAPQSGTDTGQTSPTNGAGARLTIKTKSSPPVHGGAPIGVNEPGVNLRGIEKKDIRRGMVIVKPGSVPPHTRQAGQAAPTADGKAAPAAAPADGHPDTPAPAAQAPEPVH